jgi:phospholipase C
MPAQEPGTRPHRPTNYQLRADVTVNRKTSKVTAALANTGQVGASFAIYPDDLLTFAATPVTVLPHYAGSYVWDASQDGYYGVVITASTGDGFRRRCAGRIA